MKNTMLLRAHHTTLFLGFIGLVSALMGFIRPGLYAQPISGLEAVRSLRHPQNYEIRNLDTWFDSAHQLIAYTRVSGFPNGDTLVVYDYAADVVLAEIWGPGSTADIRFMGADDFLYLRADTIFRVTGYPDATSVVPVFSTSPRRIYAFTLAPGRQELAVMLYESGSWSLETFDYDTLTESVVLPGKIAVTFPDQLDDYNTGIAYSPDGRYIAMNGGYEREYVFILRRDGSEVTRIDVPDHGGTWSPVFFQEGDSLRLAVGGGFFGGVIEVIDVETRRFAHEMPIFPHYNYQLALDPTGSYMLAGGYDGAFKLLEVEGEVFPEVITIDSGFVSQLAFTADSGYVVAGHGVADGARLNIFRILRETVGEEVIHASPVGLFPNPVTDNLWINESFGADVTVFDMQGRIVIRRIYDGTPLDVAALPEGIYVLKAVYDGRVATGQFVKVGR